MPLPVITRFQLNQARFAKMVEVIGASKTSGPKGRLTIRSLSQKPLVFKGPGGDVTLQPEGALDVHVADEVDCAPTAPSVWDLLTKDD